MACGERLSLQRHHIRMLWSIERARVRIQDSREERGRFQQTESTIRTVQTQEQVQCAIATWHAAGYQGRQKLCRSAMGTARVRWRQQNHRLCHRETRGGQRDVVQVQRVQRRRYRVHGYAPDRAGRLRVQDFRGECGRQVRAELVYYPGEDLRSRGRREARVYQESANQSNHTARQNPCPRVRSHG